MKFNLIKLIILIFVLKSGLLFAQEKMQIGVHIYNDKLTYITLKENSEFEYLKYYNWSPFTIEEKRKIDKSKTCGTIGYVSDAKGKGKYEIKNGKLILEFSEFKKYMDNKTDPDKETKTMEFIIVEFIN